ncbi:MULTISPECIES: hypothetical protein [unclassified Micromonospora]|uniref:hypothetical protein n=1 Tax=unclassified Micromonospora TaxID=2617518 RepID=UPI0033D1C99D
MPGTTANFAFPYQTDSDAPNGPLLGQQLAEAVDAAMLVRRPLVGNGALSSLYTLTNTQTDLAGTTVTINVPTSAAVYFASWTMAGQLMTAGNITAICQLVVDTVAQTAQAIWNPGNVAAASGSPRGGKSQQTSGLLSGSGNHVFKLQAQRVYPTGSTGDIRLDNVHTNLSVLVIPL